MNEARERLEHALTRLEAAVARPKPTTGAAKTELLETRCASLEAAAREAVARLDRLLADDTA